uniref:Uncharacterized protein n=1 Tax=Peronospora matthiolae TaxID=2874970 RepID=A0AAV1VAP6_9STRA
MHHVLHCLTSESSAYRTQSRVYLALFIVLDEHVPWTSTYGWLLSMSFVGYGADVGWLV